MGVRKNLNLSTIIEKEKWTKALERICSYPKEAQVSDEYGYLPIHRACECESVPIKVIESLIDAYPESVEHKSPKDGLVPLNFAVSCKSSTHYDIVKVLLRHYKEGASMRDRDGRAPLHSHLCESSSPSLDMVKLLVKACPDAVRVCDNYKWYPLHYAAKNGNLDIAQYLIDLYPDSLLMRTENGETPIDVASSFGQRQLCYKLREEEETRFDSKHICISPFPEECKEIIESKVSLDIIEKEDLQQTIDNKIRSELSRDDSEDSLSVNALLSEYCYENTNISQEINHDIDTDFRIIYKKNAQGSLSSSSNTPDTHGETLKQERSSPHNLHEMKSTISQTKSKGEMFPQRNYINRQIESSCKDVAQRNGNISSYDNSEKHINESVVLAIDPDSSLKPRCKLELMEGLMHNLEEAEIFWDVQSLSTQSILHRVMAIEKKVFHEVKEGGVKARILALFYVNGSRSGTWAQWVNGIEYILLNGKQKGSIVERIEYLEWLVEGELKTGDIRERLLTLNRMQTEVSFFGNNEGDVHERNQVHSKHSVSNPTNQCSLELMSDLLKNLEGAEAMWDVLPSVTKSVVHRISTIENIIFHEVKEGGLKSRLLALFYVDGMKNGTWEEWINGIEFLLQNERRKGSIVERIKNVELLVEGEAKTGNFYDRLLSLNEMSTQHL